MNKLKYYLKYLIVSLISIILSLLLISSLYYFNIINNNVINYLRPLIIILNVFIISYIIGKHSEKKGYLEGIKFGLLIIFISICISFIFFRNEIKPRIIIYETIILGTSMFGSMVGINKKKKN